MTENRAPVRIEPAPTKYRSYPDVDRAFAIATMQANYAELDMARMAMQRGNANDVKGMRAR